MILTCPACSAKYKLADTAIPAQGRKVRCAACGHSWHQEAAAEVRLAGGESGAGAEPVAAATATAEAAKPGAGGEDIVLERRGRKDRRKLSLAALWPFKRKGEAGERRQAPRRKQPPPVAVAARQKVHGRIHLAHRLAAATAWLVTLGLGAGGAWAGIHYRADVVKAWPQSASLYAFIGLPANLYGIDFGRIQVRDGVDARGPRIVVGGVLRSVARERVAVPYLKVTLVGSDGKEKASWMVDPGITVLEPGQLHPFETVRRNPPMGELTAVIAFAEPPPAAPRPPPPPPEPPTGKSGLMGAQAAEPAAAPAATDAAATTPAATSPATAR